MNGSSMPSPVQKEHNTSRLADAVARGLLHPRLTLYLSAAAVLFTLPALWVGLQFDDYSQRMAMLGLGGLGQRAFLGVLDVYSFLGSDPSVTEFARNMGGLPWWAPDDLRVSFLRYLSAAFMWLDYRLWPGWPSLMHAHSLLWYAAVVFAVTVLYRRMMGVTVAAGLAALFYALDYAHAMPVGWLANRYALLCAFFGILSLLSYDRWRRERRTGHGILSPVFLALALLSGEMAVATGAYLLAYALFLDGRMGAETSKPSPLRGRLLALWPCAVVFLAWALWYHWLGYGTHGSGYYIDPLGAPVEYLQALVTRAPILLMGQWSHISADLVGRFVSQETGLAAALIFLVLAAFLVFPLLRKDPVARFWFTGMILSLVPVAATSPSNRLLIFVGIGALGLLAQTAVHLWHGDGVLPAARIWRIPAAAIVFYLLAVRLVISPPALAYMSYYMKPYGEPYAVAARQVISDPAIADQELVLVQAPEHIATQLVWFVGAAERRHPAGMRVLAGANAPVEMRRIDANTLWIRIYGGLFQGAFGRLFRSLKQDPIRVNDEFDVPGMTARVIAMHPENGPEEIIYTFSDSLESRSFRWLRWANCRYETFTLPPVGKTMILPGVSFLEGLRGGCRPTGENR